MRGGNSTGYRLLGIRYASFLFLLFLFSFKGDPPKPAINAALDAFIKDPALQNAGIGFCMKEVESGALVYQYNANQSLVPASTMKIVTTATALQVLGEDYQFNTRLIYTGKIDTTTGTLNGDLIVVGSGDPALGSNRFQGYGSWEALVQGWVEKIKAIGIQTIKGGVNTDDTHFEKQMESPSWLWEDIGNYYGAGASGLNINENIYELSLTPGKKDGDPVTVGNIDPKIRVPGSMGDYMQFESRLTTTGTKDNGYIFGSPYTYTRVIEGTIPLKPTFKIKGSMPDPSLQCCQFLYDELVKNGVKVESNQFSRVPETKQSQLILETSSPPLRDLVKETNLNSLNLYAECMLKELGYKAGNTQGSTENGSKAIVDYWKKKGLNVTGLFMKDGSGLSPSDGVSAGFLVDMLLGMKDSKSFYNSLPVSGQSGSMKNMGNGTFIEGNLHAKTGHMERVRSYAGYVKGKDGKMYSFALIVNNYTCSSAEIKQKIEKVLVALGNP